MSPKAAAILVAAICIPLLVMCVGMVSAIAIPNLLDAIERSRQKRAVSEMRSIGTAIESYATDEDAPPALSGSGDGAWQEGAVARLEDVLLPDYIRTLPPNDPWGRPYLYGYNAQEGSYYLLCLGKNGTREIDSIPEESRRTHCYESDILFMGGQFVQYPDGKQRVCGDKLLSREPGPGR